MGPWLVLAFAVAYGALAAFDLGGWIFFWPLAYAMGLRVLREGGPGLARPDQWPGAEFDTAHASFKMVFSDRVLVRDKMFSWNYLLFRQGVYGTIRWDVETAVVEARLPIMIVPAMVLFAGLCLFVLPAIIGWSWAVSLLLVTVGWALGAGTFFTRRRMRMFLSEYGDWQRGEVARHVGGSIEHPARLDAEGSTDVAPRFVPPPWEQEQFDALAARDGERDMPVSGHA